MADEVTSNLRPQLLGRMTQRAVVEALKSKGPMSRADIARLTGISPTTVSSAVNQVLQLGLVEETDAPITGPGRPGKILRLATVNTQVIGVSVEPDNCELIVGGLDGEPLDEKSVRFPTPNTYARLLAEIERHAKQFMDSPDTRTLGLGLSLPGVIDPSGDRAVFSPNFHQTDNERPAEVLAERLKCPTILIQESDALCLAERRVHKTDDLSVLDFTTGLGIGVLTGGRLLARHLGLPRELGHVTAVLNGEKCGCGNFGCLETVATDVALARKIAAKLKQPLTTEEVFAKIRSGEVDASAETDEVLSYLAVAIAATTNLFAPPLIVLYGQFVDLQPGLFETLRERAAARKIRTFHDRCRLAKATTTKAQGAVAGILDFLFEELGPLLPTTS